MKAYLRICAALVAVFLALGAGLNVYLLQSGGADGFYRVEAKRLMDDIEATGTYEISQYPHITGVYTTATCADGDLYRTDNPYLIAEAGGTLYRIEYITGRSHNAAAAVNTVLIAELLTVIILMAYGYKHVVKPFGRLNDVPRELARGNLAVPIPEEKSRLFGKFTWGVNLLRESIEKSRKREVSLQRDKKLLLLSLSHDIKTPLSSIKLNSKALAKGLYKDEQKRREAAESINARADEIEAFVKQITEAAGEDFMTFEVEMGEVFLEDIITRIRARYEEQLRLTATEFVFSNYTNCLLACDGDRLGECLQNLMENAIKYGDGRRIELSFDKQDGCELITVTNTGCSLDKNELPVIFESFHRGSNAKGVNGNGLGLFICRKLMVLMGGEAFAEIKDDRFSVTLVVRLA